VVLRLVARPAGLRLAGTGSIVQLAHELVAGSEPQTPNQPLVDPDVGRIGGVAGFPPAEVTATAVRELQNAVDHSSDALEKAGT